MAGIVVVFDFDKTIIDCDSDNWVVDELGFTDSFNHLLPTMPWNSLMDTMMKEVHSQGKTTEDIAEVLQRIPIHPRVIHAIKAAHVLGCDLRIVSDVNMFFIETILMHLGIRECFSEINTNPGFVNEEGRLRILPYHDFNKSPHGCSLCPPNMCKGLIIERIQNSMSHEENKRIIYLGDGSGDYCPSVRLKEKDFVMPRKNFPVWDLIYKDPLLIKAEIHEWSDGEDLERVLLQLINKISIQEGAHLNVLNCKTGHISRPQYRNCNHRYDYVVPQLWRCSKSPEKTAFPHNCGCNRLHQVVTSHIMPHQATINCSMSQNPIFRCKKFHITATTVPTITKVTIPATSTTVTII